MKKPAIVLLAALALSGCGDDGFFTPTKTVDWYKTHEAERKAALKRCNNNPGDLKDTPTCINATRAENKATDGRVPVLPTEKTAASPTTQTVGWYKTHDAERKEVLAKCNDNPGELQNTPDCINAARAEHAAQREDDLVLSRVAESVAYASAAKTIVAEFYAANAGFPSDLASIGFDPGTAGYVRSVTWNMMPDPNAATGNLANITITLMPDISPNNATYTLYLSVMGITNGVLIWKCNNGKTPRTDVSSGTLPDQYTPRACQTNG
ncbi:MAG: EexN family lipoprotein [Methylobacillus sp.]|jgi:predicted Fe-S protein YdhL (DUF1289 family)|nr:EexN family lipoprotein [Methylobacillus sp.]